MPEEWLESGEFLAASDPAPWERLSEENTALHKRISDLTRENLDLKSKLAAVQSEIARFEGELHRGREDYEAQISLLETDIKRLHEELKALKDDKTFLEQNLLEELRRLKAPQRPA